MSQQEEYPSLCRALALSPESGRLTLDQLSLGRTDDMMVVRGVNVFPSQIEEVVLGADGLAPHYLIVLDRPKHELDMLEVWVEASPELEGQGTEAIKHTQARIIRDLQETLGLSADVSVLHPNSIQRSEGKAKRVIEKRELTR